MKCICKKKYSKKICGLNFQFQTWGREDVFDWSRCFAKKVKRTTIFEISWLKNTLLNDQKWQYSKKVLFRFRGHCFQRPKRIPLEVEKCTSSSRYRQCTKKFNVHVKLNEYVAKRSFFPVSKILTVIVTEVVHEKTFIIMCIFQCTLNFLVHFAGLRWLWQLVHFSNSCDTFFSVLEVNAYEIFQLFMHCKSYFFPKFWPISDRQGIKITINF